MGKSKSRKLIPQSKNRGPDKAKTAKAEDVVEYRVDPVTGVRHVVPYVHVFTTFAKGRWLGRQLMDVLLREFGTHPKEYVVVSYTAA